MAHWKTLSSKVVYENKWMAVYEDEALTPAGQKTLYGHVHSKSDAVYIVAIDDKENTYLTLQQRYVSGNTNWECPAGRMDDDSVIEAAKRELLEETGVRADNIEVMAQVEVANGIASFKMNFCIATGLKLVTNKLDQVDGIIATKKVPLTEVYDMILRGEIVCAQSIAAFYMTGKFIENKVKG